MERDNKPVTLKTIEEISTHTLTWSVTRSVFGYNDRQFNFNSHAHVERDFVLYVSQLFLSISTHTLTWSVTHGDGSAINSDGISTHTLTWSVTK